MSTRHFTMGIIWSTHLKTRVMLKNENQSSEHVKQASYCHNQQNKFNQTHKNKPKPYSNNIYLKSQQ